MSESLLSSGHQHYLQQRKQRIAQLQSFLCQRYPDPTDLILEIGCGHGHFLNAYAQTLPGTQCLGLDLVSKRIRKALRKRDKANLSHLEFLKADIAEFSEALPEHIKLLKVFVLFPDPWPKNRHRKNRIIQTTLLDWIARHATVQTTVHMRTDHDVAFTWALDQIASHPLWQIDDLAPWPFEHASFFQDLMDNYFSLTAQFVSPEILASRSRS